MYYYFNEAYEKELKQKLLAKLMPKKKVEPQRKPQYQSAKLKAPITTNQSVVSSQMVRDEEVLPKAAQDDRPIQGSAQPMEEREQPDLPLKLMKCPQGCERSFNEKALKKHVLVCKKMSEDQREVFDSKAQREADGQDDVQYGKGKATAPKKAKSKVNWKEQSAAFRMIIQTSNNPDVKMTSEQEEIIRKATTGDLVQCEWCGRKFNETTAEKHIPFCKQQTALKKNKVKK